MLRFDHRGRDGSGGRRAISALRGDGSAVRLVGRLDSVRHILRVLRQQNLINPRSILDVLDDQRATPAASVCFGFFLPSAGDKRTQCHVLYVASVNTPASVPLMKSASSFPQLQHQFTRAQT